METVRGAQRKDKKQYRGKFLYSVLITVTVCLFFAFWTIALSASASSTPLLYVFLQTSIRPNTLQKALEKKIPNTEIIVFGRYRDFEKGLKRKMPDAVIAMRPVLDASNLSVSLKGVLNKDIDVQYVIITDKGINAAAISEGKTIGVVDILGRKQMADYVSKIMNIAGRPKLKLVTKNDDLLPLLQLNLADAILLPKHMGENIKAKSKLKLSTTELGYKVGLPSVSCLTNNGKELCNRIKKLDKNLMKQIGVDRWTN